MDQNKAKADGKSRGALSEMSVRGKLITIAVILLVTGGYTLVTSSGESARDQRDSEVIALMGNYSADEVSIYDGGWTGADGSIPGRYTLHVTKDGVTHSCHQVSVEALRAQEPIKCKDGAVIAPKEVRAVEGR